MIETDSTAPTSLVHWKPRFFTIWTGQALSLIGSALTQFVLLWWITQSTNSVSALSFAALMGLLPTAIFSPFGGALADRWSRRTIMIVADAVTAACMVILILLFASDRIELWHVYLLMFVRATMQSFQQPAAMASVANLVPTDWLSRAGGMNQSLQGIMTVVAAPLGALALAFLPLEGALMIDVVTALLGIVPLLFYRIPQPRTPAHAAQQSLLAEIREGARYVAHRRSWLMLFAVSGLVVLTVMPTFALTPLLVKQHFGGGVNEVALMEAMAGVGVILGGLLVAVWTIPARRIATVMVSFAISCGAVALTAMAPSNMLLLAVFWWFVSGASYSTGNAPMMAIVQINIPNVLQGRVISLLNMLYGLAGPIGLALAAPVGELVGVQNLYIIGGTLSALVCLAGLCSPALRNIERV